MGTSMKIVSIALLGSVLAACGGGSNAPSGFSSPDAAAPPGEDASADAAPPLVQSDASLGGGITPPPTLPSEVYGNSADTLYKLDPDTKAVEVVGKFVGCTSVIDIALDKDSRLFGTTS